MREVGADTPMPLVADKAKALAYHLVMVSGTLAEITVCPVFSLSKIKINKWEENNKSKTKAQRPNWKECKVSCSARWVTEVTSGTPFVVSTEAAWPLLVPVQWLYYEICSSRQDSPRPLPLYLVHSDCYLTTSSVHNQVSGNSERILGGFLGELGFFGILPLIICAAGPGLESIATGPCRLSGPPAPPQLLPPLRAKAKTGMET